MTVGPGAGDATPLPVAGLVLAAGAGRRMGGPKALLRVAGTGETFVVRALRVLDEGGCAPVVVVLGAAAEQTRAELPAATAVVLAADWAEGMGASLRAGLQAFADQGAGVAAVVVTLVDLPDVGPDTVRRVVRAAGPDPSRALVRAAYGGTPGHPVLLGRSHWDAVARAATGDRGPRDYLATQGTALVECGDLATGRDVDTPDQL